ncbi:MAG TPA: hypothetical protein VLV31_12525 [Candidatus Acidoferrales bacterium]|nr:hypothetical protein [Candidatus Acidoferrales bacterium]
MHCFVEEQKYSFLNYSKMVEAGVASRLNQQQRLALVNVAGLASLIAFTSLVYVRTQQPIILIVGGLISVIGVMGTMMRSN